MPAWVWEANLCLAFAVQYFRDLSGSLTWPSLQHCPHTNFIFRFKPRPRPHPTNPPPPPPVLPPPMPSPPLKTPPETTALLLLLIPLGWWGPSMGWRWWVKKERLTRLKTTKLTKSNLLQEQWNKKTRFQHRWAFVRQHSVVVQPHLLSLCILFQSVPVSLRFLHHLLMGNTWPNTWAQTPSVAINCPLFNKRQKRHKWP